MNICSKGYIETQTEFFIQTKPAFLSKYRKASLSLLRFSGRSSKIIRQYPSQVVETRLDSESKLILFNFYLN